MRKANVQKLEKMAADFLQHRYKIYKMFGERDADLTFYGGACAMLESFGCYWERKYVGNNTEDELNDIRNYSHWVSFPDNDRCDKLNANMWED